MSNDQNYSSKNIKQHFEDLEFWSFDLIFYFLFFIKGRLGGGGRGGVIILVVLFVFQSHWIF